MVDRDIGEHVFVWQIENFGENKTIKDLRTPAIVAGGLDSSQWTMVISLRTLTDPQYVGVFLHRCGNDDGPRSLTLAVEFCLIDKDGCEQCHGQLLKPTFRRNEKFGLERFLHLDTLSQKRHELMPNDVLTLKCRAWRRTSRFPATMSFAYTQILVEESSFKWTIRELRKTSSSKRVRHIDSDSFKNCFELVCESVDIKKASTIIRLAVVPTKRRDTSVWMSVEVTAMSGQEEPPLVRVNSSHLFEPIDYEQWQFPNLVLKNAMRNPKDGNRVYLSCDFTISTTPIRGQTHETSCDIFELDDYNLRKDLRSFYQKTAWCPNIPAEDRVTNADIILRTDVGDKVFRAHKVILSARSPVFREILNEFDFQKKHWLQQTLGNIPIRRCRTTVLGEGMRVRLSQGQDILEISDITMPTLSQMLEFMYSDEVEPSNVMDVLLLLRASSRFQFRALQRKSRDCLKSMFTLLNFKRILSFDDCFEDLELRQYFLKFIRKNRHSILSSEEWADFVEENEATAMEIIELL